MQQAHHNEAPKPSNPGTQVVKRDRERPKGSKDKRPHVRSDDLIVNGHRIVRCTSTERFFELLEDSPAFNMHDSQLESKKERLQHAAANIGTVSTDDYDHDYSYDGPKAEGLESVLLWSMEQDSLSFGLLTSPALLKRNSGWILHVRKLQSRSWFTLLQVQETLN